MPDRNLADLDPKCRHFSERFLDMVEGPLAPSTVKITTTWRGAAEQNKCAATGLSNAVAGQSPHNCTLTDGTPAARAFDFSVFAPDGSYVKDGRDDRYQTCGLIAESLGLVWGGRFKKPDYDHVELPDWRSA